MKFSELWLRSFADPSLSTAELAQALTMAGLEVESIEPAAPPFSRVVVAEVLEVARHPNADRLSLCKVTDGVTEQLIVCGAKNLQVGQRVPLARPGAVLPGGKTIEKTNIRGVESQGMICSKEELGLGHENGGIMVLEPNV